MVQCNSIHETISIIILKSLAHCFLQTQIPLQIQWKEKMLQLKENSAIQRKTQMDWL